MDNRFNQNNQSPRYMEIGPNGQILRQRSTIPPEVMTNYLTSQESMSYNNAPSTIQWSTYPYQTTNKKQWWHGAGPFNPYRTTYQDYGQSKYQSNSMSNFYYTQPNIYDQGYNTRFGNWNSSASMYYPGQDSISYSSPRPPQ